MKTAIKMTPFEIFPATFELNSGQSIILDIIFSPNLEKTFVQEITIVCDNCQVVHSKLKGKGEIARVSLDDIELGLDEPLIGEFIDINTKNLLRFEDLNPYTYTERIAKIRNCTKTELHYQWMIYKPVLVPCFASSDHANVIEEERVPDLRSAFSMIPNNGILQPSQTAEFRLIFAPLTEGNYHSVAHMLLQNVPPQKTVGLQVSSRKTTHETDGQLKDEFSIFDVGGNLQFKDVTALGFEMKGKCIPLNVVLHPYALFIEAQYLRGSTIKRMFTMANHSYSTITFRWESYLESYIIEVEPPFGDLDPGMAMDFDIRITGTQPGKINHNLLCHIMNMPEPLYFPVAAEFKGPELRVDVPSINFGFIRVGQYEVREMTIINTSEAIVRFTVTDIPMNQESRDPEDPNVLRISETSGELPPFGRKIITLSLFPTCAASIQRICLVQYEDDKSCSVGVFGEAQNPVVCFLECEKFLPEVYLSIPTVFTVQLHNQTLLPTTFKWGKVEGSQSKDCMVEFHEEMGEIQSWQQKTLSVTFTALKPVSFSDVSLPCHIAGQNEVIYVNINCDVKTLDVSYKISTNGLEFIDNMELDFGDKVPIGDIVRRYFHICNHTAIPAHFSVSVDYFVAGHSKCLQVSDTDTSSSKRHGLLKKTPYVGDSLSKTVKQEYNKLILSKKGGAAFVVHPSCGQLKPFGTQVIEISAYSDMWGNYKDSLTCKVGELEEVKIPITFNVFGCPLTLQITAGLPGTEAIVRFGSHVAGTGPVTRKLKINNSSPLDIRVDWQVFKDDHFSDKLLDFITYFGRAFPSREAYSRTGEVAAPGDLVDEKGSCSEISKDEKSSTTFWSRTNLENTLHVLETSRSSLGEAEALANSSSYSERQQIAFCSLRSHHGIQIEEPFNLKPSQVVIPANGHNTVEFTFNPKFTTEISKEMEFNGYVLGFLSLDNKDEHRNHVVRQEAYDAKQLHFVYSAHLKPAMLSVEELDEDGMRFMAAISDIMKDNKGEFLHTCSVKLTNDTLTPVTFDMKVKEPFLLIEPEPSTNQICDEVTKTVPKTLRPRDCLISKVAFRVSEALLPDPSKKSGESLLDIDKKLTFEDNLIIRFTSGTEQKVPLYATLTLPQMELSDEFLDFGMCFIGQTRELVFDIYNTTTSHCYWSISIETKSYSCDDHTFQAQPDRGMLEAFITHVSKSRTTISIFFTAKASEPYDCTFVVQGRLGEYPRRVVVIGHGSYDGKHEAILDI